MNRRALAVLILNGLLFSITCSAALGKPEKESKDPKSTVVDSGTFGIIVGGRRVATESFHVEQRSDLNIINSELKFDDASVKASQSSEMQLMPTGSLKKYTWKETQPGKSEIVVEPQDANFLVAHIAESAKATPRDTVYPLSSETVILDDNFFSHMELLTWKYMALACGQGQNACKWLPFKMPVFIPHQQASTIVTIEFAGMNKMKLKGIEGEFRSFKLQGEAGDWILWLNDQNKLVRVLIASDNTEVLRD